MKIYRDIPDNKNLFKKPVVTVGNFDGLHAGHVKILNALTARAEAIGGEPLVVTFAVHPRRVLYPEMPLEILTTADEKINAVYEAGVRNIIVLDFTRDMAEMSAWDFYNKILIRKIDISELVIGYDHAFGKNREGNFDYIMKMAAGTGIAVTRVDGETLGGEPISSTRIRGALKQGDAAGAAELLGRPYSLGGRVVRGVARGRILGFPTANIEPESVDKIIPMGGVYAVEVEVSGERFRGMMNVGSNPTFDSGGLNLEVNIFNFDRDIYDAHVRVYFLERLRDEKKFSGPEELMRQLQSDCEKAAGYFEKN